MPNFFTMNADVVDFVNGALVGKEGMRIHFDMNIRAGDLLTADDTTRPSLIDGSRRITGYIRSDGRMYDTPALTAAPFDITDPGTLGLRLLASDTDLNTTGLTYRVTFEQVINGKNIMYREFTTTAVPATDTTVDLATYSPTPRVGL